VAGSSATSNASLSEKAAKNQSSQLWIGLPGLLSQATTSCRWRLTPVENAAYKASADPSGFGLSAAFLRLSKKRLSEGRLH
jgi:hypothetical protein